MVDKTQLEGMVESLTAIKEEFFRLKDEQKVSIRKDAISVQLKTILQDSNNYDELKGKIELLIKELTTI